MAKTEKKKVGRPPKGPNDPLDYLQQIFVIYYCQAVADVSRAPVKKAAEQAGVAYSTATQWMGKDRIKQEIQSRFEQVAQPIFDKYCVTQERIIRRYAQIAFHDPFDAVGLTEDGEEETLKLSEMTPDARLGHNAKMADVKGALDSLARINGMFKDSLNVTTFDDILKEVEIMDGSDEPLVADDNDEEG